MAAAKAGRKKALALAASGSLSVDALAGPLRPADWWRHAHHPGAISRRAAAAARRYGLRRRTLCEVEGDRVDVLESVRAEGRPRVYLSAGIHGDEPGGIEGLLRWLEEGPGALNRFDFTIIPCLNPGGLRLNIRTDVAGRDLNRSFNQTGAKASPSIAALKKYLPARTAEAPFALALLLHEDYDACGLYLYELNDRKPHWGRQLLDAAHAAIPSDPRPRIEGRVARAGVMVRDVHDPALQAFLRENGMAEAPHLVLEGQARRAFTVESPSEFDLDRRAEAHRLIIGKALELLAESGG